MLNQQLLRGDDNSLTTVCQCFEQFSPPPLRLHRNPSPSLHRVLVEQLLSADDFLIFKAWHGGNQATDVMNSSTIQQHANGLVWQQLGGRNDKLGGNSWVATIEVW